MGKLKAHKQTHMRWLMQARKKSVGKSDGYEKSWASYWFFRTDRKIFRLTNRNFSETGGEDFLGAVSH